MPHEKRTCFLLTSTNYSRPANSQVSKRTANGTSIGRILNDGWTVGTNDAPLLVKRKKESDTSLIGIRAAEREDKMQSSCNAKYLTAQLRPKRDSQACRIFALLEAASGGKISLLEILRLNISQYGARIHELRYRYGYLIENGCEPGQPDHTWFRLVGRQFPSPDTREDKAIQAAMRGELETAKAANRKSTTYFEPLLFPDLKAEHRDLG